MKCCSSLREVIWLHTTSLPRILACQVLAAQYLWCCSGAEGERRALRDPQSITHCRWVATGKGGSPQLLNISPYTPVPHPQCPDLHGGRMEEKGCRAVRGGMGCPSSSSAPLSDPTALEQPCLRHLGRGQRDVPQKRGAEPALSLPLKCTRLDHLPLNLRGQESKVNLPGWLTHGFGSHGGDVGLFRVYFPAEAAVGVTAGCSQQGCAHGAAEQLSCARARLAVLARGHGASVTATATQGPRLSPHTVLLTPTFHCPPSVQ